MTNFVCICTDLESNDDLAVHGDDGDEDNHDDAADLPLPSGHIQGGGDVEEGRKRQRQILDAMRGKRITKHNKRTRTSKRISRPPVKLTSNKRTPKRRRIGV